ncbi:MAG: DUF4012 domain-containing protein [Dehalococcoidia bacterium]
MREPALSDVPSRRLRGYALGAALLLALLVATYEGFRAWQSFTEVNDGRDHLEAGQDLLEGKRLDATPADLEQARSSFELARERFASAGERLRSDPAVAIARRLPLIGGQANAAVDMAEIGESAAAIGIEGVEVAAEVERIKSDDGTLLEKTMVVFDAADPHMANIEASLSDVDRKRDDIGDRALLPPMRDALDELDERRRKLAEFLDEYRRARAFAPDFLGFDGPRTYLIMAHNEAELLPGGGLVSVAGVLRLNEGRIEELEFRDAVQFGEEWMDRTNVYIEPPRPLKQYLLKDTSWNLLVSNWSPDFSTSAATAQQFFEWGGGPPVDGVIGINVHTLEELLAVTGPVYLEDFDLTVDTHNAFDLTEANTRIAFEPQGDRKQEFIAVLADEVLDRVLRPAAGTWSPLLDTVRDLGDERDLQLYSYNPRLQSLIREFGWDGELEHVDGSDSLMLVDASVHSTKLNAVLDQDVDVEVRLAPDGSATTTVTVDYFNDLASWERGRDPALVEKLMLGGLYGGYLRLYVAPSSTITSVKYHEEEVGLEEVSRENGLRVFGRFFALPRDQKERLVFTYETPGIARIDEAGMRYTLRIAKQSGTGIDDFHVRVVPPEGMTAADASIDGKPARAETTSGFAIDLTRDRVLTLTFTH